MDGHKDNNKPMDTPQSRQSESSSFHSAATTSTCSSQGDSGNTVTASSATTKIKWHIPTPKQVGQIKAALNRHNSTVSTLDFDNTKPDSPPSSVPASTESDIAQSPDCNVSSKVVDDDSSKTNHTPTSSSAKVQASYGYISSSSSDSSDDSSSDDEAFAARNSGKLVINLDGGPLPKQLMMRCRVRLTYLTYAAILKLASSQSIEEYLSNHSDSFTDYPLTVNTVKETNARPSSKKRLNALFSKTASNYRSSSIMGTLQKCRNCRVLLSDCWKGKPLPSYVHSLAESFHEEEVSSKPKKSKKKKKKMDKVRAEPDSDCPKMSRTKSRKVKSKDERKRVIMEDSSGEDELVVPRKGLKRSTEEATLAKHSRHEKVKELADKKSKDTIDTPKEGSKSKSSSSIYRWSESVMTAGLPKIPKLKKTPSGSYVPPSQQQMDSNFRQVDNPYDRLQKREARRREFEKMAAMKYGGHGNQDSSGLQTSNDGTLPNSNMESHNAQATQRIEVPASTLSHQSYQGAQQPPVSAQSQHGPQAISADQMLSGENITHINVPISTPPSQELEQLSGPATSSADQAMVPSAGPHSDPTVELDRHNTALVNDTPFSSQNYQIPEPPIPRQAQDKSQADIPARSGGPLLPEPPLDPRALLPHPNMPGHMPSPVIPLSKSGNALLPAPATTVSNVVKMSPDCSSTEPDVSKGKFRFSHNSPATSNALLPEPDSLLPSPGGLLPVPNSLLPDPPNVFHAALQSNLFNVVREDEEWNAVRPHRLHNELNTTNNGNMGSQWKGSQTESSHMRREPEASHQTMPADSTSNDDIPVNQQVMDEICRLSLEISKRIARKAAHHDDPNPPIIPLEPDESQVQGPAQIPLSNDEPQMICYDYGHTRPPLPKEDGVLPTAPVPRGPTPPPALAPPPSLPKSLRTSGMKPLLNQKTHGTNQEYEHYNHTQEYEEGQECQDRADVDQQPISSRHFEEPANPEESYEDILAIEQARTRRELYYEDLRRSAQTDKRDRYQRSRNRDRYSSRGSQDYDSNTSLHQYENRRSHNRSEHSSSQDYESDIGYSEHYESTHYSGYGGGSGRNSFEGNTNHHSDSRGGSNRHYESRSSDFWDRHEPDFPHKRQNNEYQMNSYQRGDRYTEDTFEDPYYTDNRNQRERVRPDFQTAAQMAKDRYGLPIINTRPYY